MENVEWGEYELNELFEINSSKKTYHANKISKIHNHQSRETLPYVVRTTLKNGIRGYINEDEKYANEGTTLSFAQDTFSVFFQKQKYFTGNKVKVLKPKFKNSSEKVMNYLTASFQKALNDCTWGVGSTVDTIKQTKISLPTKNGEIDFDFMESFIADLEAGKIARVKDYLVENNLENCELTSEEKEILEDFENEKIEWGEFKLNNLFDIATGRDVIIGSVVDGKIPLVSHQHANNGISKNIAQLVNRRLFDFKKVLSLADRGVFLATTQGENFHIGTRVKALTFKEGEKTLKERLYMVTSINQLQILFTDYSSNATDNLPNLKIQLPTKNNQPDYEKMEILISAVQKLTIKDVVAYTEKKLHKIL